MLVKGVPRTEGMKYDPNLGRMVREGSQLVLNPFDQRALRVALELRRPGESITAMSLGPAEVRPSFERHGRSVLIGLSSSRTPGSRDPIRSSRLVQSPTPSEGDPTT